MRRAFLRVLFAAIVAVVFIGLDFPTPLAVAQQASPTDPNANAVHEQQLLQEYGQIHGLGSIPDVKSYTIEQPMGRSWRVFHEVWLHWIGDIAVLGMIVLLAVFYLVRGRVKIESGRSGVTVARFSGFERFVHWMTATCFIILALSGLNITFGKEVLLPLIGPDAFSAWSRAAKYAHNFLSFPFTLGIILIFLMWLRGNIPNRTDIEWIKRGGGIVGHDHPPAYRFNAGQKGVFWMVILAGTAIAVSGYLLIFPFYVTAIFGMQIAQMAHGVIAVLFVAGILAHIYIGTIGMEGAFEAMGEGTVDLNWAKEHHSLWLKEEGASIANTPPPPPTYQRKPSTT
jgi:formate dehydrogenase subunit gamma